MKVEPVAYLKTWTRDGEERKRVDLYPEPDAWMDSFKATPLHAIRPGYALVRVEQVKDAERYCFIRDQHSMGVPDKAYVCIVGADVTWHHPAPKALDILIDQAITAAKGE